MSKLRSACDACAAAKIKCDKNQPSCDRCRQLNFSCAYSPSRRHGKQSWASRAAQAQAQSQSQLHPRQTLSLLPVPAYTRNEMDGAMDLDSFGNFDLDGLVDLDMISAAAPMPPTPLTTSTLTTSASSLTMLPAFTTPTPIASPTGPATRPLPSTLLTPTSPARFQPGLHDCQAKALTTLQSLHYCTMYHSELPGVLKETAAGAPPQRPSSSMLPLDKILLFNRLATATVRRLLSCPCAQQPHVVLLYLAILSRSLEWYRFAMSPQHHFNCPSVDAPTPSDGDGASSTTAYTSDTAPARGVKPASIQIGDFHLEEEDQRALMRDVLAREVKKLSAVLDDLQAQNERTMQDNQAEDESTPTWSHFGIPQMRAEVRHTIKCIKDFGGTTWPKT
jgi:hypothetical protein